MEKTNNSSSTGSILIAIIFVIAAVYYMFKYIGIYIAYGFILLAIGHLIYNILIKNFSKKTVFFSLGFVFFALVSFGLRFLFDDSGHQDEIRSKLTRKAESMGMTVNSIDVDYIGNSEYRCKSDIYDPGTLYSQPNRIKNVVIYKWEGDDYKFVRNEN
jgi:hypothetical protein